MARGSCSSRRWPVADVSGFAFSERPLDLAAEHGRLADPACGGYASFEGWVRDFNDGRPVQRLEYEAYVELAVKEGERIVAEAIARFGVSHARCVHRVGDLALGELAVWVGVSAPHRGEAFAACRYIIDEVKHRVPIWKKEHYVDGDSGWVNCERCAAVTLDAAPGVAASAGHDPGHAHAHHHDAADAHAHADTPTTRPDRHPAGLRRPDYSRQVVLPEVGEAGQARIRRGRVLVIGAGGLGVPVLTYLAGAGVGALGVVDGDVLEPSNLHRQTLYRLEDAGRPKALLAAERLRALNPEVDVRAYVERADRERLPALAAGYDVLVDCSDNFTTRFVVNDVAVALGKPAVLASVYQYEGQLQVLKPGGACLRCVWPDAARDGVVGNCAEAGVLGPVPGVLGSLQALEVLKLLLGLTTPAEDAVILVDLATLESRRLRAHRAAGCAGACVRLPRAGGAETAVLEIDVDPLEAAASGEYVVVDLREPHEVLVEPLPGPHLHIPLDRLLDDPAQLDAGRRYLLVCARGQRSRAAAETLRGAGIAAAYSMRGGLSALRAR
ncbi:MAG: ThiF family adenylyltransferase [Proteobacteria bacterium]|nr:ThiF family adenylyltransferase [Pseudomonadota bacterium]